MDDMRTCHFCGQGFDEGDIPEIGKYLYPTEREEYMFDRVYFFHAGCINLTGRVE